MHILFVLFVVGGFSVQVQSGSVELDMVPLPFFEFSDRPQGQPDHSGWEGAGDAKTLSIEGMSKESVDPFSEFVLREGLCSRAEDRCELLVRAEFRQDYDVVTKRGRSVYRWIVAGVSRRIEGYGHATRSGPSAEPVHELWYLVAGAWRVILTSSDEYFLHRKIIRKISELTQVP